MGVCGKEKRMGSERWKDVRQVIYYSKLSFLPRGNQVRSVGETHKHGSGPSRYDGNDTVRM